eukprot:scaffold74699_cov49-Attheya_sp.AAC.3
MEDGKGRLRPIPGKDDHNVNRNESPTDLKMRARRTMKSSYLQERRQYADAFLERCHPTNYQDANLPPATYISPWIRDHTQIENIYECSLCGISGPWHALENGQTVQEHKTTCIHLNPFFSKKVISTEKVTEENMEYWASRVNFHMMLSTESMMTPARRGGMNFGRNCFRGSLIPSKEKIKNIAHQCKGFAPSLLQIAWTPFHDGFLESEIDTQSLFLGLAFTKEAVWGWNQGWDNIHADEAGDSETTIGVKGRGQHAYWLHMPFTPLLYVPRSGVNPRIVTNSATLLFRQHGGSQCDVWSIWRNQSLSNR